MNKELDKQINWLKEQVTILTPTGTEATDIPESIMEFLKGLRNKCSDSSESQPEPLFTDDEYRILLAALGREREVCEKADGEDHRLQDIMSSIEKKIQDLQYPESRTKKRAVLKKKDSDPDRNIRTGLLSLENGEKPPIVFDWRAFEAGDYAQYCTQLQDGIIFSGDYIGAIRFGDMACDMTIYSTQQDEPITEDDEAHLTLSFYVGGVDTGYAYGRNGYPYDYVESMDFRFDSDMSHMMYEDFQDTIEKKIVDLIPDVNYDKADLIDKACGELHIW